MEPAAVVETHISVLFFYGDRVYKLRKPVTMPFLDFSTRELRLADCLREVELNRRLAPDVYLGVHDVVNGAGVPVDHLVVMRRMPDDRRLSALIADPAFDPAPLVAVARQLVAFHARAQPAPQAGTPEHLGMLWSTNLVEIAPFADAGQVQRIGTAALTYLHGRHELFARRVADARIVDGHGDLLAADIFCLDDGPRILDCIEFDERFRCGDVLYDTGFLAMDLEHLGRADLAALFLAAYREFSAETHPASLEHWYIAYRALVRAKIAGLRGDLALLGAFLAQSWRHLQCAQVRVVLVGGLPGTGKTTVAEGLGEQFGWEVLRSDTVRKDLAGLGHTQSAAAAPFEGIYREAATDAVYAELLRRAGVALGMGESVVLDATWLHPEQRDAARALAGRAHARIDELCCELPLAVAAQRIAAREHDASDATAEVLAALARRSPAPWPGAVRIDTGADAATVVARAVGALDAG